MNREISRNRKLVHRSKLSIWHKDRGSKKLLRRLAFAQKEMKQGQRLKKQQLRLLSRQRPRRKRERRSDLIKK